MSRGGSHWTAEENAVLRERYPDGDLVQLARDLGRTRSAIMYQASMLRIRRGGRTWSGNGVPWRGDEIAYLREHYPHGEIAAIAAALGRSPAAISIAAHKHGIKRRIRAKALPPIGPKPATKVSIRRETVTEQQHALRKRRLREAVEAMVEHGVDEVAAELAAWLIVRGRVPGVRMEG